MLSLVSRLFKHYCDHHFTVTVAGFPIYDGDGKKLGHVDRMSYGRSSVRLEGWSIAEQIALGPPSKSNWQRPSIKRADVNASLKLPENTATGFNLVWFGNTSGLLLSLKSGQTTLQIMCPNVARFKMIKAQVHIRVGFAKSVIRAAPLLARAFFNPSTLNKSAAKRALRMRDTQLSHILDSRIFEAVKASRLPEKLTLVMPVFNAIEVAFEALDRIVNNTDVPWRLILVEDCSTDERMRPRLNDWVDRQRLLGAEIVLLENEENLGFIGSVNRAFKTALAFHDHVVLINSDALVPSGWASRLIAPIMQDARIASVTPLSNDAEIFTAPTICKRFDLGSGSADRIDEFLSTAISSHAYKPAPTGVGFCMAISQKFLGKIPQFDTVFGKGYGEEVDWCLQAKRFGGVNVVQPNVFVEHRGGASFGSAAKQAAIARNNQLITNRYPGFDQSVQTFMATDPIRTARVFAACGYLTATQARVEIYFAHSLGGGAELYLQDEINARTDRKEGVVVVRIGGPLRWRIEAHLASGMIYGDTDDDFLMARFLKSIPSARYVYSCAVGDPDPIHLTSIIRDLVQESAAHLTFLVHDFFALSPSYCLLDSDGIYRPERLSGNLDPAHVFTGKNGSATTLAEWRSAWLEVLNTAKEVICFSQSSADILRTALPTLKPDISICPHRPKAIPPVTLQTHTHLDALGILGDIGLQKGARCLEKLSKALPVYDVQRLVIVGRIDPRFSLGAADIETGAYQRTEISALAEQHKIKAWLIPSIWPETFSYTTHEALATGLPVFCFDIGAQKEAVERAENGHVIPSCWVDKPDHILTFISEVLDNAALRRRVHTSVKKPWNRSTASRFNSAG